MHNKEKTLLILSPGFPANEGDSICLPPQQSFILAIKNNFPELKIIILSFEFPHSTIPYDWNQILVIPFNGEFKRKLDKFMIWYRIWRKLKQIRREYQIIGLFSFWCAECALIGKYFAKMHALKHYCWILGQDARKNNRLIKWIRPVARELVAMSDFLAGEFFRNHQVRPAHTIPNGIDTSLYLPGSFERDIDILGVGSLIALKQYDIFIRLISEITKKIPSIRSRICGKGPEKKMLQELIGKLQLERNILLAGEKDHQEVLHLMQRSKILLHTSSYEGFSTVCLEALYAGAQVISFCRPMERPIQNWHFASNQEEMLKILLRISLDPANNFRPVLPYPLSESATLVLKLFKYPVYD
jgi:glycosyltransferase involved in cell wall biosynthesis